MLYRIPYILLVWSLWNALPASVTLIIFRYSLGLKWLLPIFFSLRYINSSYCTMHIHFFSITNLVKQQCKYYHSSATYMQKFLHKSLKSTMTYLTAIDLKTNTHFFLNSNNNSNEGSSRKMLLVYRIKESTYLLAPKSLKKWTNKLNKLSNRKMN